MAVQNDYAELAQMMQNFFDAMHNRTDVRVDEAIWRLEALHGEAAAIEAMVQAAEAMRAGEDEICRFWMSVYARLIAPGGASGAPVTFH